MQEGDKACLGEGPPGWFSWTTKLWLDEIMNDEDLWLKVKMEHLLHQKEKVASSWGYSPSLGAAPGWFCWTSKLWLDETMTDQRQVLMMVKQDTARY